MPYGRLWKEHQRSWAPAFALAMPPGEDVDVKMCVLVHSMLLRYIYSRLRWGRNNVFKPS